METEVAYGAGRLSLRIPEHGTAAVEILEKVPVPPLRDPVAALREALVAPAGAPPLAELARGRRDAMVVVPDITRPAPSRLLLPPLLDALAAGGIGRPAVTVLVATGLHRPCTADELDRMLGPELARGLRVLQHDGRDADAHADLGRTRAGLPIRIDRRFCEADLRIVTGLVEPHLMAGYSGGRKGVCPGLAAAETIRVAHGPAMLEAHVGPGILDGNPLHDALLEVARTVGVHFSVDVALDRERRVAGVFAGDVEAAHAEAVRFVAAESRVSLDAPVDLAVVSGGGAPLDATLYQSIKGVCTAMGVVRPGSAILLCAALSEGIGSASFEKCLRESGGPDAFEACLRDPGFFAIDQWMVQHLCQARRRARLLLYTDGVPPEALDPRFVEPVPSPEDGVARALAQIGPGARVAILPQGPYVLATVRGATPPLGEGAPYPPPKPA